jgi:hypothetical protein
MKTLLGLFARVTVLLAPRKKPRSVHGEVFVLLWSRPERVTDPGNAEIKKKHSNKHDHAVILLK